ncbi:MAG: hypothetical protein HY717_08235 [Planctomycetes bacterium]|nr:hypothetical protein [Planctomycetota bacterium]
MVFGSKAIAQSGEYTGYRLLVAEIARFFKTGKPPVNPEETLGIMDFMEAVDESQLRAALRAQADELSVWDRERLQRGQRRGKLHRGAGRAAEEGVQLGGGARNLGDVAQHVYFPS